MEGMTCLLGELMETPSTGWASAAKSSCFGETEPEIAGDSSVLEGTRQHFSFLTAGSWNGLDEAGIKVTCLGLHRDESLPSWLSKCKNVSGFGVKR